MITLMSTHAFSHSEDYSCKVRQYQLDITLTQDTSTSMWFRDRSEVLAMGYAGWVEKSGANSIYHFYPGSFGTVDITFNTQDAADLPAKINGTIYISGSFFVLWDNIECFKRD